MGGVTITEKIIYALQSCGPREVMSPVAIKKFWLGAQWNRAAFRRALKQGVDAGDFTKVKASYKLSAAFKRKRSRLVKRKQVLETRIAEVKDKRRGYDPIGYSKYLKAEGFHGWQLFEMMTAYDAAHGYGV